MLPIEGRAKFVGDISAITSIKRIRAGVRHLGHL